MVWTSTSYRRETVGLVGESGSGKTTLGRAILGLYQPSAGKVLFNGQDVSTGDAAARQKLHRNLQMVFQNPYASLNPRMTVAQTIEEALRFHAIVPAQSRSRPRSDGSSASSASRRTWRTAIRRRSAAGNASAWASPAP